MPNEVPQRASRSPLVHNGFDELVGGLCGDNAGIVGPLPQASERSPEDERPHALRVGRGKQDRERSTLGESNQDGVVDVCRVGDRSQVVHALLCGSRPERAVGKTRATLVEEDDAPERREALKGPVDPRHVPHQLSV